MAVDCDRAFTHAGGSSRLLRALKIRETNNGRLVVASREDRSRAGIKDRRESAWVFGATDVLRGTFSDSVFINGGGKYPRALRLKSATCYTSGKKGSSKVIFAHHAWERGTDYLAAPLSVAANLLDAGLGAVGGDYPLHSLYERGEKLYDLCEFMADLRQGRVNAPFVETTSRGGSVKLYEAMFPGRPLHRELLVPVSPALRQKAGLGDDAQAFMFKPKYFQPTYRGRLKLTFVDQNTVLLYEERTVEATNETYKKMKVVHGRCPITGVGGTKGNVGQWPVVLHHMTIGGRHYLVGFIHNGINVGLGALLMGKGYRGK